MSKFFIYALSFMAVPMLGQDLFGPQQVIIDDLSSTYVVNAGDLDGDGFIDLMASGRFDDRIVWFRNNQDANGFGEAQLLVSGTSSHSVHPVDIDDDGDLDVVYTIEQHEVWLMYNQGNGIFGQPLLLSDVFSTTLDVKTGDFDLDGDQDVLTVGNAIGPRIFINNQQDFSTIESINGLTTRSVEIGDIDNDGDLDIVSSTAGSQTCVWYENLGDGTFSSFNVIRGAGAAGSSVFISDLNGDAKLDILLTVNGQDTVSWFENLGNGAFGNETIIDTTLEDATRVIAADLDNDGDIDVVANSFNDVFWFENLDGLANFSNKKLVTAEVWGSFSTIAADLDNDGDLDLATASRNDSTVAWYENLTILGVNGPNVVKFEVYPNPSTSYFVIQVTPGSATGFTLYDMQGKLLQRYPAATTTIDARSLPSGVYMLALKTVSGKEMYQQLIKK